MTKFGNGPISESASLRAEANEPSEIGVIGCGTWGMALARLLTCEGHVVRVWCESEDRASELRKSRRLHHLPDMEIPSEISFSSHYEDVVSPSGIVLVVTTSQYVRSVARAIAPLLDAGKTVVCATKGIETGTLLTMTEVLADEFKKACSPYVPLVALSGPTHAEEVARDLPCAIVAASYDLDAALYIQRLFSCGVMRVYTSLDARGVELAASLKNVIALACGISEGLGCGDNAKAALITRGVAEVSRLGVALGCEASTFVGLAGVGDLVVTASSKHSRNNRAGRYIGEGMSPKEAVSKVGMVVEGLNALPAALQIAERYDVDTPIIHAVDLVVNAEVDPRTVVDGLMGRDLKAENSGLECKTVMTYGTFDLLHYGHINLLRRARRLGDRLVVAISTDEFNWNEKGKRCYFAYEQRKAMLQAIRYVDEVVPEQNWEQKRADMHRYGVDIFVMGDDWEGKFDFLREEGVEVVYLPRTPEISTTQIKSDLKSCLDTPEGVE